ncbi:MAG: rhomboid family intramembrane serine protease [Kangiellaceae bacterium]|jgi:membrane associated rhomboid family serine protease|nr:rhomboid family intramembrane serine protease [Kangiellaceae bacterium]
MKRKLTLFNHIYWLVMATAVLWLIKSIEVIWNLPLVSLGIYPREFDGLIGIIFAPFIHGSWSHLAANTLPIILFGSLMAYGYPNSKWRTLLIIWLISGIGVWLFGRPSFHIGASGITHGLFYFVFLASIIRRDRRSIALMFITVFMYGSMLLGVLPWDAKISFEAHLFGAIGGIISAILFRHRDPKLLDPTFDWESSVDDELYADTSIVPLDSDGYDRHGYDSEGFDRDGFDKHGRGRNGERAYWLGDSHSQSYNNER